MRSSLTVDQTYHWQGFGDGFGKWDSHCRIRIFHPHPESVVVVASDQGNNTGTSITNCAAELATLIVSEFQLNPLLLSWIEHYPDADVELSQVEFDWQGEVARHPRWVYLSAQQAAAIAGTQL